MRIAVACDHAAYVEKGALVEHLKQLGHHVDDCGVNGPESVDYPDYAKRACERIQQGKADFGILLCGSGIGMSMAANKMKGIRAALLADTRSASLTRNHNNANVICFGARMIDLATILACTDAFLASEYEAGRHDTRIAKMMQLEGC